MSNDNYGPYVVLDDGVDHAVWAGDFRYNSLDSALKAAKKHAWKKHRDFYVDQLSHIELAPSDATTTVTNLLEGTPQLENKNGI